MKKLELLSPAKNLEYGISAINAGADAVYIGADSFGARSNASNSIADIAQLCDYAHKFGAKVYVALNTIIEDSKLAQAEKLIWNLHSVKVDAIIVQDMGILSLNLPPIELHASTQCHINSVEKAQFLERAGFDKLVLARELPLSVIEDIVKNTNVEIEVFVHGALCVSYSGQCYLSYAIGKRSANRGECGQACRLKYELLDSKFREIAPPAHYLSLKDMNRLAYLERLVDIGVSSFKIEGRLKDKAYLKNVTNKYSKQLDTILAKRPNLKRSSFGKTNEAFEPSLDKVFNRGFCAYHLEGTEKNCSSFASPKARGEYMGKVKPLSWNCFDISRLDASVYNGDGFFALDDDGYSFGFRVEYIERNVAYCQCDEDFYAPMQIWRNSCTQDEKVFAQEFQRKLPANISIAKDGQSFVFNILGENGLCQSVRIGDCEISQNRESAFERINKALKKSGQSIFEIAEVEVSCEDLPHLKVSDLNDIRRKLCEKLEGKIIETANIALSKRERKLGVCGDCSNLNIDRDYRLNVLNSKAEEFYKSNNIKVEEYALEYGTSLSNKTLMRTRHCILRELNLCKKTTSATDLPSEPIYLKQGNMKLKLEFDCKACEMNVISTS
ncbi:MAG: U32 family peptidase [Opitutales bacterium]